MSWAGGGGTSCGSGLTHAVNKDTLSAENVKSFMNQLKADLHFTVIMGQQFFCQ